MGVIIPEGFYQATLIWTVEGLISDKVCTLGLTDIGLTTRTAADCADDVYDAAVATGSLWHSSGAFNEWAFQGVSAIFQDASGPLTGQHIDVSLGTQTGESIPANCSVLVKKVTGSGGRKNRGRNYWPPYVVATANCPAGGNLNSTLVGIMQGQWDTFYDELISRDWAPTLFHSDATSPTPMNGFSVESRIATQRRRIRS